MVVLLACGRFALTKQLHREVARYVEDEDRTINTQPVALGMLE